MLLDQLTNVLNSINAEQSDYPFRPVRCREKDLETRTPVNGFIYFTTDTHKIFMGYNDEYVSMGGNSGVYYGRRILTDDEKYGDDILFSFSPSDIDGNQIPVEDDLILNIPDGGFYRVLSSSSVEIETQRLMIAGGTGGPDTGNEGSLSINYKSLDEDSTIVNVDYFIKYEIIAKDSAGDLVKNDGTATYRINGVIVATEKVKNGYNEFNVAPYLDITKEDGKNTISVTVSMDTGGTKDSVVSKKWIITVRNLSLKWKGNHGYSKDEYITGDKFTFTVIPSGNTKCTLHMRFSNGLEFEEIIQADDANGTEYITQQRDSLDYGTYSCEMYLTADDIPDPTPIIKKEVTFIYGGSSTLLTVPFYAEVATQYKSIDIPFLVYDPDTEKCLVSLYVNDIKISDDADETNLRDRSLQHWIYTPTESGPLRLTIATANGDASKEFLLLVDQLDLNAKEPTGAVFSLKANHFSTNDELKKWQFTNGSGLRFSENFDWNLGGLKFNTLPNGDIEKYILIPQGSKMFIEYNLFEHFTGGASGGKCFKFCFKTTNCYDYAAPVLSCYSNNIGLQINAQSALFESGALRGFNTQYKENSYIELEAEIWPNIPDVNKNIPSERFMMFWIDGVPAGVRVYSYNESGNDLFSQTSPKEIEIGSNLCDVWVYVAKAYERKLATNEHINNFILDAPSATEMLKRYERNDILTAGEISYEKLVKANPGCRAYVYDISRMTKHKKDKIKNCKYYELIDDYNTFDKPYYKSTDATIYAQGTSSVAYGVAAFNLRTEFTDLTDKDGKAVDGWKVSDNAIPISVLCSKVNVASCENVNNVVNQEWYHRFQPYHDAHRRKSLVDGKSYRDTMQFESGVMFIKDSNPNTNYFDDSGKPEASNYLNVNVFFDTEGYIAAPYYKQYAICNVGNDKKNLEVFHDINNPLAMCVEIKDNTMAEHWMNVEIGEDNWAMEEPYHEFRYPDGNSAATDQQKQLWMDFVKWMVASNPIAGNDNHILKATKVENLTAEKYKKNIYFLKNASDKFYKATEDFNKNAIYYNITAGPAEEDDKLIEVIFDNYTYKGFDPPGYENTENPTGVSLKGVIETAFSTTKVQSIPRTDEHGNILMDNEGNVIMTTVTTERPYTHDTYEYRMAKMLSECEDHLVMDSIMYHYLFVQRHTLVDNIAKNTFWSTEDGIHWDLTKDYDNDTSDGNNNSGFLVFTYGIECLDKNGDENIFNGPTSVWFQFAHGLQRAQANLHEQLNTKGAWNVQAYLDECKRHQEKIPERCWIEDYFRKYLRPYRLGLDGSDDSSYIQRLDGGKKTHQREAYEVYQDFYLNSKYISGNDFIQSTAIDMRLNNLTNTWDPNYVIPISFYIDCYGSLLLGGRTIQSQRLKRGDIWNIPVGSSIGDPTDATCYIYGTGMVKSLTNLHKAYPTYVDLKSSQKLQELSIGSSDPTYYNTKLQSLSLNNSMLRKLQVQRSGKDGGINTLNLSGAKQLTELQVGGSKINSIELADGSPITLLELNAPNQLVLSNLQLLTPNNLSVDNTIINTIQNLYINNCPAFNTISYGIAKDSETLTRFKLNNVDWLINNSDLRDFEITNSKVTGLLALDNLNDENTNGSNDNRAISLTGKLTIDVDCPVDEYEIYKKYIKVFPDLSIEYTNNVVSKIPAAKLIFYTDQTGNAIHYKVLGRIGDSGDTISTLISEDGPIGVAISIPRKESTLSNTYTFTGRWIDKNDTSKKYYNADSYSEDVFGPVADSEQVISFKTLKPEGDMEFYPEYVPTLKTYSVRFYDWDNKIILQNGQEAFQVGYNENYKNWGGPMVDYYERSSEGLSDYKRYTFLGWSKKRQKDEIESIPMEDRVYLDELVVTSNVNLYACYKIEDVRDAATNQKYFTFIDNADKTGYRIGINNEYLHELSGKITLPSYYGDKPIYEIKVEGFRYADKITHIFFLEDAAYTTVGQYGFANSSIKFIDLPETITTIGESAFYSCYSLETVTLNDNITSIGPQAFAAETVGSENMKVIIEKLPENLETLGYMAFYGGGPKVTISKIPDKLQILPTQAFARCDNVRIQHIPSSVILSDQALYNTGKTYKNSALEITIDISASTIEEAQQKIGSEAFKEYFGGASNKQLSYRFINITDANIILNSYAYWGLDSEHIKDYLT